MSTTIEQQDWRIRRVPETGSTNADLARAARTGAAAGSVLVAEYQSAGRGRLARGWASPAGAGLTFSVLLRPAVPNPRWGWLPMVAGLAVVDAVFATAGVRARLKWPNDVLVDERKLCGILSEAVTGQAGSGGSGSGPAGSDKGRVPERSGSSDPSHDPSGGLGAAVVIGIGLNVASVAEQLPSTGTSVSIAAGRRFTPDDLLAPVLEELGKWYGRWHLAGGDADVAGVRAACRERSATLGRTVTVQAGNDLLTGEAEDLDADGRLLVRGSDGRRRTFGYGDVTHATLG